MLTGNRDANLLILSNLDDKSLLNFCTVDKAANELCKNESFWLNRFINKYGSLYRTFKTPEKSWREFYLQTIYFLDKYEQETVPIQKMIQEAANGGMRNLDIIKFLITYNHSNWRFVAPSGIIGAKEGGHKELEELFRERS